MRQGAAALTEEHRMPRSDEWDTTPYICDRNDPTEAGAYTGADCTACEWAGWGGRGNREPAGGVGVGGPGPHHPARGEGEGGQGKAAREATPAEGARNYGRSCIRKFAKGKRNHQPPIYVS